MQTGEKFISFFDKLFAKSNAQMEKMEILSTASSTEFSTTLSTASEAEGANVDIYSNAMALGANALMILLLI